MFRVEFRDGPTLDSNWMIDMTLKRIVVLGLALVCVSSVFSSVSSAQHVFHQPVLRSFRLLGEGYGPSGYHFCNPGPNVDYYNPYSAHNSMLISRMPEYQQHLQSNQMFGFQSRRFHQGIPFSVYAAPQGQNSGYGYGQGNGYGGSNGIPAIESSFEAYEPEDDDDYEDGMDDEDYGSEMDEDFESKMEGNYDDDNAFRVKQPSILRRPKAKQVRALIKTHPVEKAQNNSQLFNPFADK